MSFSLRELANGYYVTQLTWRKERTVIVRLTLTDPDGDVDEHVVTWAPSEDKELREALVELAAHLDDLPHIRAIARDLELAVGPADPDYQLALTMEMAS
jgi:hypothetical protein